MVITPRGARKHHVMGMEGRCRDGSLACLVQKAGVRLDARELSAFEVEDFDGVVAGTSVSSLVTIL